MQTDQITGNPINPNSWNRYSYVLNNPLKFVDPTGLLTQEPEEDPIIVRETVTSTFINITYFDSFIAGGVIGLEGLLNPVRVGLLGRDTAENQRIRFIQQGNPFVGLIGEFAGGLILGGIVNVATNGSKLTVIKVASESGLSVSESTLVGETPDLVFRGPRLKPLEPINNPNAAKTPGEHLLGGDHLPGSPFRSYTSDRAIAEEFAKARGTTVEVLDLKTIPKNRITDLRTPAGRAAAADKETNPYIKGLINVSSYDSEVIIKVK